MCTAITYRTKDHYFGRTLDYEVSYGQKIVITPRNYEFLFRKMGRVKKHYAMIGMAVVVDGYPLYYDATNEKGLSMAGLNFPGNADYRQEAENVDNIAPFELIPWILRQCRTIAEAKELLSHLNLVNIHFSEQFPLSPLHWMISDRETSIVVESVKDRLKIYDNPIGVLTNNPPFDYQLMNLNNYMGLSIDEPVNHFSEKLDMSIYSRGMGALGLPGDLSSVSRFVRAAFTKFHAVSGDSESESISQFFHILGAVEQPRGCVRIDGELYELTIYTSCCNTDKGIYYYRTYDNSQITGVDMYQEDLDGTEVVSYPLVVEQQVRMERQKNE